MSTNFIKIGKHTKKNWTWNAIVQQSWFVFLKTEFSSQIWCKLANAYFNMKNKVFINKVDFVQVLGVWRWDYVTGFDMSW